MSGVEIVETLGLITKMQSDIIDSLFRLLMQHMDAEELGSLGVIKKIEEAARLRADLDRSM